MATRAPKEKRRNSEKRKEKSRDAARCRRSKESEIFTDMAHLLPVPASLSSQLDKASIMRLTIAFLKARSLLGNSVQELCSLWNDEKCSMADACWPQALGGILLALSSEGDIIYLTENVTQQLGLPQVDLIGQSIYDYCHPCDHDELREALSLRPDGDLARSFFLRLKSTLTVKGRSSNLKAASYKVMNCSGRIVPANAFGSRNSYSQERVFCEDDELLPEDLEGSAEVKMPPGHFLVLVGDPIPHPSNIEMPLDSYTFLTKHTLDMKYTYVDEKIFDFFGYTAEELEGQSAYQLHHAQDNDEILKSYKTLFMKGQIQTPPYRFMARRGGYAWVQTQATLVYGNRDFRPQAVVCVHTCLSEIEDGDQILFINQKGMYNNHLAHRPITMPQMPTRNVGNDGLPQNMTSKLFVPKTADMDEGFLTFDKLNGATVLKKEPEDLTHLAPTAGDTCIPLDLPSFPFLNGSFEGEEFMSELLECLPLTGFELPLLDTQDEVMDAEDQVIVETDNGPTPASAAKEDPFIFFNIQSAPMSNSSEISLPLSVNKPDKDYDGDFEAASPSEVEGTKLKCPAEQTLLSDDEEELSRRAPYISMSDEVSLFDPAELFSGLDLECFSMLPISKTETLFGNAASDQSVLVKLLQNDTAKPENACEDRTTHRRHVENCETKTTLTTTYQATNKRGSSSNCPADDSNPKRLKTQLMKIPTAGPFAARVAPPQPSRGASSSLFELLTEKPLRFPLSDKQSSSVLQNLLVSGHDLQTGHELQGRHSPCKSSTSSCSVSLLSSSSLPSVKKDESPMKIGLLSQPDQLDVTSRDSVSSAGSVDVKLRNQRAFNSLNTFPFDMDVSPGPSSALDTDSVDFFGALNMSGEFVTTDGATE